jgi:tryptophan halogenase
MKSHVSLENKLDNIVVVGGGTAGWITSLMLKFRLPNSNITVIESEEIGILGAGEGTTPTFINFLNHIKLPIEDLVINAGATFKNGIKFTNWKGDGSYYYHEFPPIVDKLNSYKTFHNKQTFGKHSMFYWLNALNEIPDNDLDFISMVSDNFNVPFIKNNNEGISLNDYDQLGSYGVHFNAVSLAEFLKKTAISRGISRIEGKVVGINSKDNGDISSVVLEDGSLIELDFIFDCSGFHRLFIGSHYKSEWISYSDKLLCDSAIPFFLPIDNEIPPYTESIAMSAGWMWKIPTQNRYGCGYVFDSSFITADEAKKEIENYLGIEISVPRVIPFNPGRFSKPWMNNCIAIGLSTGFVEPLEATSIGVALINLSNALSDLNALRKRSETDIDAYNKITGTLNDQVAAFLYLHYMTSREDTPFWMQFKDLDDSPEMIRPLVKMIKDHLPNTAHFLEWDAFNYLSFYQITKGMGLLDNELLKEKALDNNVDDDYSSNFIKYRKELRDVADKTINHKDFIINLGGAMNDQQ